MSSYICPLCEDLLTEPVKIYPGKRIEDYHPVATGCGHLFHKACLFSFLVSQGTTSAPMVCPQCRRFLGENSVVELLPESDENFQGYSSLLEMVNQGTRNMTVLCQEMESLIKDLYLVRRISSQKRKAAAKQAKQLRNLQMQIDSLEKENELLAVQRKVLKDDFTKFSENWETSFSILETKVKSAEIAEGVSRNIIQAMNNLEGDKVESEGEHFQRRFTNADEIINKIGELLINYPCGDAETTSELKKVLMQDLPKIIIPQTMFGMPTEFRERKLATECAELVQNHWDIRRRRGVTVYFPRGKTFFPSLEIFQLQMMTFLRAFRISYVRQIIDPNDDNLPVVKIADQIIYAPEACCEAFIKLFIFKKNKSPKMSSIKVNIRMRNLWDILVTKVCPGMLLWQWSHDNGHFKAMVPKRNARVAAAIKSKVQDMASQMFQGNLTLDEVSTIVVDSIRVLSEQLGNHNYFNGDFVDEIDCTAFVLFAQILWNSPKSAFQKELLDNSNLRNFVLRMQSKIWPDWQVGSPFPKYFV